MDDKYDDDNYDHPNETCNKQPECKKYAKTMDDKYDDCDYDDYDDDHQHCLQSKLATNSQAVKSTPNH